MKQILNFKKRFILLLMSVLGFSACSKDNPDDIRVMYGTPNATYQINGLITDQTGKGIDAILITPMIRDFYGNLIPYDNSHVSSNYGGKFFYAIHIDPIFDDTGRKITYLIRDIDGAKNGGEFEEKYVDVTYQKSDYIENSGSEWHVGTYAKNIEITLTNKK